MVLKQHRNVAAARPGNHVGDDPADAVGWQDMRAVQQGPRHVLPGGERPLPGPSLRTFPARAS